MNETLNLGNYKMAQQKHRDTGKRACETPRSSVSGRVSTIQIVCCESPNIHDAVDQSFYDAIIFPRVRRRPSAHTPGPDACPSLSYCIEREYGPAHELLERPLACPPRRIE